MKFVDLLPHEQYEYLQDKSFGLEKLYSQAKDDLVRLTIIRKSNNLELAHRLYSNTKYPKIRAILKRLLAYSSAKEHRKGSRMDLQKIAAMIKQIIPSNIKLTDEQMKSWAEDFAKLNENDKLVSNFAYAIVEHMKHKVTEDFPISYYFKIMIDAIAKEMGKGVDIKLPKIRSR